MGNDGGSIPDRRDLVKNKPKAEQADKANQTRARWFFCALSKRPLQEPVVSCALGKLYNKDAIIEYLLDKSSYGDGEEICGHIRSLKDIKSLKLTPNPIFVPQTSTDITVGAAPFICPLTLKEMNGGITFVYIATCGCVLSQSGLKVVSGSGSTTPPDVKKVKEEEGGDKQLDICPQCATKYDRREDVRVLNPEPEVEEEMRAAMDARKLAEPPKSKSKKRKADASTSAPSTTTTTTTDPPTKKTKHSSSASSTHAPSVNPSIAAASRAVVSSLALEEAKRKAGMSDAVKSLYESQNKGRKETFMTRGTFTRYA
ncbi:DUF602-domain-containing protein [Rickenella mellea]|uniref:DUF602-domain-containing protein n=1 Tax=Rickenella mellea TaxID=50990 RepID=A0A4Y7Q4S0_9AGAM|nr:DUF602-domain-containing protein [Rickenella mellea]